MERYLRRLSRWAPRACRHDLIAEAARHLYDATRKAEAAGLPRAMAQQAAIQAFGPAWRIGLAARGLDGHGLLAALRRATGLVGRLGPRRRVGLRPWRRPRLF